MFTARSVLVFIPDYVFFFAAAAAVWTKDSPVFLTYSTVSLFLDVGFGRMLCLMQAIIRRVFLMT